ncbi:MAG TPA: hypothetical protein VEH52_01265 [Gaiellaceae bacterium]|jgi:hypothetical protein|nr:hypothetical protein [Gaiellaceae bacterium]
MRVSRGTLIGLATVSVVAAFTTSCGNPVLEPYKSPAKTSACLRQAGYQVASQFHDIIAHTALRGTLRATHDYNSVTVLFGQDPANARALRDAYRRVMPRRRAKHILDITDIEKNALLLWVTTPPPDQLKVVVDCLA